MTSSTTSVFTQIFKDNWDNFKKKHPSYANEYYENEVKKALECGDPSFGYIEYACMYCGTHRHRVAFTCKGQLCLRCSRVKSENFVYKVMSKLHKGVVYRHLILTIPDQLIKLFYRHRKNKKLYNLFYQCAWRYIQDVFETVTGRRLRCGAIIVLHTTGRKGNFRPHLHIIVMNGGIDLITGKWINIGYFTYEKILPRKWQWHLLGMVKDFDQSKETKHLIQYLWKKYKNGFYNSFKKGDVPSKSQHLVRYLSKYLFRPQISVKRIRKYDFVKSYVIYEYEDHKTGKVEVEKVSVTDFIGRMVQQVLPKGFHRSKSYGLHYGKNYEKSKELVQRGLANFDIINFEKDATLFKVAKDSYQDRIKLWTGQDPLECPECGHQMELVKIWTKEKGVVFDLLEFYRKKGRAPPIEFDDNVTITEPIDIIEKFFTQLDLAI